MTAAAARQQANLLCGPLADGSLPPAPVHPYCPPPFTAPPRSLSKLIEESTRSSSVGGMLNPRWLAPEVLTGGSATAASDVFRWAFGVVKRMALMGVLQLAA